MRQSYLVSVLAGSLLFGAACSRNGAQQPTTTSPAPTTQAPLTTPAPGVTPAPAAAPGGFAPAAGQIAPVPLPSQPAHGQSTPPPPALGYVPPPPVHQGGTGSSINAQPADRPPVRRQGRERSRYVESTPRVVEQRRSGRKSAAIVAGSAGAGAAIGALAGGGKGAGIGAIVGGVGGLIYDRKTHKKRVVVEQE